jgi:site-specific DNA-methyltransferase (cytosine-N4-specific)
MKDCVLVGDCLLRLRELPSESVHCCVTSPPFWGLRDYGSRVWLGGTLGCSHDRTQEIPSPDPGEDGNQWRLPPTKLCLDCNAWYGQLGLEPELDSYIAHMVEVFREVRRVLHTSGVLWLNLGDGYARQGGVGAPGKNAKVGMTRKAVQRRNCKPPKGLKSGDLMMIPARVALALQADGWWLRAENIWHKPNAMPESVRNRTTRAHEKVYMLTKNSHYFYDAQAIRGGREDGGPRANRRSVWSINTVPYPKAHFAVFPPALPRMCILAGTSNQGCCSTCLAPNVEKNGEMRPTCSCGGTPIPCTVLDPFAGSGTTLMVAKELRRSFIGIELNDSYKDLILDRLDSCSEEPPRAWELDS